MRHFLLTFELMGEEDEYVELAGLLSTFETATEAGPNAWLIESDSTAIELLEKFKAVLLEHDTIALVNIKGDWGAEPIIGPVGDWLQERCPKDSEEVDALKRFLEQQGGAQ